MLGSVCGDVNDGTVDTGADKTKPGDGGSDGRGGSGGGNNNGGGPRDDSDDSYRDSAEEHEADIACRLLGTCPEEGSDPITIHDLASFTPEQVSVAMEPDGWMIVGLPANFYADAAVNTASGELFDIPINVRFTPTRYSWSWGDGTSSTTSTRGSPWDDLDVPEFTATATSHTFTEKGTYKVSLTVDYSVEIRTPGEGWFPVEGTLSKAASGVTAIATTANSVIVKKECTKNPDGPGC
ncbi:PKD domain-containing protein [Microbacterium sp. MPKO10]|uniref:PKD domain-containing protein n=1 Tax=Microbacterium sp. MPKO10 TaxID=2989818 RepID=UPI002235AFD4|nr:hypothetical protein [Microbacterium sp. MPKO10]MCW4458920.1 hypothetical protein [Microbacterium sp. MPKO10]